MSVRNVFFDLDGTLLPMDQDEFVKVYFKRLAVTMAPHGYRPDALIDAVWKGTEAMVRNDGNATNENVFWDKFASIFGEKARGDIPRFEEFYRTEFDAAKSVCGFDPLAGDAVRRLKGAGMRVALATNPIFPSVATFKRVGWAGLDPSDFELVTTYENTSYCKPNPNYYRDMLARLGMRPEETMMVGNDVAEDMVAARLGMPVFLLTNCLINKKEEDISKYPHGDFNAFFEVMGL